MFPKNLGLNRQKKSSIQRMIKKIISGGQTGVDRAALDAAFKLNIPHGGWCPKGRLAELDETIPLKYDLIETESSEYSERTKLNIQDSDGTLIFVPSLPLKVTDGTILTIQEVEEKNKPHLIIDLSKELNILLVIEWVKKNRIETLNVAGPRESKSPGIYKNCLQLLNQIFSLLLNENTYKNGFAKF